MIATNLQGLVAYWSTGAERLFGWCEGEALGRDTLDLTPAIGITLQRCFAGIGPSLRSRWV